MGSLLWCTAFQAPLSLLSSSNLIVKPHCIPSLFADALVLQMGRGKSKNAAAKKPAVKAKAPARQKNHRTAKTPFEAARPDEDYEVEAILAEKYDGSLKCHSYLVKWVGYDDEEDNTWEPLWNLVGSTDTVNKFLKSRELENRKRAADVLDRKAAAKKAKEDEAVRRAALAEEAAAATAPDHELPDDLGSQQCTDAWGRRCHKSHRNKKSVVFKAFDLTREGTPTCLLDLSKTLEDGTAVGVAPKCTGGGTTAFWQYLKTHHRDKWLELKNEEGKLSEVGAAELQQLGDFLQTVHNDTTSSTKRVLPPEVKATMDRLCSELIVDEDLPKSFCEKPGFKAIMAAATRGAYNGVSHDTVTQFIAKMAEEGKEEAAKFNGECLDSGCLPSISADAWSKHGMALMGILTHGIERSPVPIVAAASDLNQVMASMESSVPGPSHASSSSPTPTTATNSTAERPVARWNWRMRELLAGAVPCSKERHTADHIKEMTVKALAGVGITDWSSQVFYAKCDNAANMLAGYRELPVSPCADHTIELSVNKATDSEGIAPVLAKCRALAGYFHSSTIASSDLGVCQKQCGKKHTSRIHQDVVTRWRSTHTMCEDLRNSQEAILLFDIRHAASEHAKSFRENRLSIEEWSTVAQLVAMLHPVAAASLTLEGKTYPTSNLVLPFIHGCIRSLDSTVPVLLPWDAEKKLHSQDLRPEIVVAREALQADLKCRWVDELPKSLYHFFLIATMSDPSLKDLQGCFLLDDDGRSEAHEALKVRTPSHSHPTRTRP